MIKARRIGHATFETPDLDRAIAYYTDVVGLVLNTREKGHAFLASKIGLLTIALEQGAEGKLRRLSFEVPPNADIAGMAKVLSEHGVRSELRSDAIPGVGNLLAFNDPNGTTVELFTEWNYLGSHHQVLGAGPLKLGHVARFVEDPKAMADFYCRVLGFRVSDWVEDYFVFLRCNGKFRPWLKIQNASHRLRDEGLRSHPGRLRAARAPQNANQLGTGATWSGP
jgi:catechol 2,3-dioxygenase-like lactoylglutathione lyase family enzyme